MTLQQLQEIDYAKQARFIFECHLADFVMSEEKRAIDRAYYEALGEAQLALAKVNPLSWLP
jgi:hypothetical protein